MLRKGKERKGKVREGKREKWKGKREHGEGKEKGKRGRENEKKKGREKGYGVRRDIRDDDDAVLHVRGVILIRTRHEEHIAI